MKIYTCIDEKDEGLGREEQLQVGLNSHKKLLGEFCSTSEQAMGGSDFDAP